MTKSPASIFCVLLLLGSSATYANDTALARCRTLSDAAPRLACYDAIGLVPKMIPSEPPKMVIPDVPKVSLVEGPSLFRADKPTAALFGMEQQVQKNQVEKIESTIAGRFEGWVAKGTVELTNGQVWQVTDGSRATLEFMNPKVAIRRGFMGAFYLEIEGTNQSPRVKRIK